MADEKPFAKLTLRLALQLAAPHTWPAAVMPVLGTVALVMAVEGCVSFPLALALLTICILFQATANTMNDYFDYVKGADTAADNVEVTDATLVYNHINPKSVLALAIGMLVAAFALGVYVILCAGFVPLIIALVGAAIVVLYSAGKTPLSYLPVGEVVSGLFFGAVIPVAVYYSLTGEFFAACIIYALPYVVGVGLIMMTNNTCDIEKDTASERKTLPMLLGRTKARKVYRFLLWLWIALIGALAVLSQGASPLVFVFMLFAAWPFLKQLLHNPLAPETRVAAMGQILCLNVVLGAFHALAILAYTVPVAW